MEKTFPLGERGQHLWTRELAREIRGDLERALGELKPGSALVIDLKGVEVFDYSFANEFFGKSILRLSDEYPGCFLLVEHVTAYARENLVKALESLGLAMIERKGGKLQLLGKVHSADQATFQAIERAKGPVTAAVLTSRLNVNLTAMNERLAKLSKLGLVRRERGTSSAGREQYEYSVAW
jgi:predicted transcriptional regulator